MGAGPLRPKREILDERSKILHVQLGRSETRKIQTEMSLALTVLCFRIRAQASTSGQMQYALG